MESKNLCGERLKEARVKMELSQVDVIKILEKDYDIKMKTSTLDAIEEKTRKLYDFELLALSKILQVRVKWLIYGHA